MSERKAFREKFMGFARLLLKRNIIWIYFTYLWNFYFKVLAICFSDKFRTFILFFLIRLIILESSFINFNRNFSTC